MRHNTFETLEWDLVLKELEKKASSELGKQYCLELPLAKNFEEALILQNQTSEAYDIIDKEGSLPLGGLRNIKKALEDLKKGAILQGTDFINISSVLMAIRNLKKFITTRQTEEKELYKIIFPLYTNHDFEMRIEKSFADDATVLDSASPELTRIRGAIRQIQQNIREKLQKLMQDKKYKSVVQETLITQRNGRYVIPVRSEAQSTIKGIVQEQSQSGATVYLEPYTIVEDNNKLSRKFSEEKNEVDRILYELGLEILPDADFLLASTDEMAKIDSIIAKAFYCMEIKAMKPRLNNEGHIFLNKVKHPVLITQKGYDNVVAATLELGKRFNVLVITGSNTGGKTVTLKTTGLCAIMAKAGLFLPTSYDSEIAFFDKILADIGDEQSIEQNLSTFSGHLSNISKILKNADDKSLVLIDEIGTGTDPSEGAAIGQAVIEELLRFKSKVIVTTHYGELKTLAYNHQGISNASVEFDSETLSPTYRLLIGVPGKSNALHIAKKYGIKKEIIARAGELLKGEEFDLSSSIENLEKEYVIISEERKKAEKLSKELEEKQKLFEQKFDELEVKKKKIQDKIQDEFETEIESALEEIKKVVRELQQDKSSQNAEIARQLVDEISSKTKSKYITKPVKEHIIIPEIKPGEYYYLERLRDIVQVISKKDNKVEVQAGLLKLSVDIMDLKKIENKDLKQKVRNLKGVKGSTVVKTQPKKEEGYRNSFNECDLRGMYVEEALDKTEKFLDASVLSGVSPVYIIHGKGTGALKSAIRDFLKRAHFVESFRGGDNFEGGEGISVVYLSKN